jgi:hypothetical protein
VDDYGAKPGEEHLYTKEAERHLITIPLKRAFEEIEEYISFLRQDMWHAVSEECLERHRKRVEKIDLLFWQKRNNAPFWDRVTVQVTVSLLRHGILVRSGSHRCGMQRALRSERLIPRVAFWREPAVGPPSVATS